MPRGGARPGAGRPKGGVNKSTLDKIAALRLFRERIAEHIEPLITAHIEIAKSGNIQALNSLWDRMYGPPKESMDLDVRGSMTEFVRVIHEHHQSSSNAT